MVLTQSRRGIKTIDVKTPHCGEDKAQCWLRLQPQKLTQPPSKPGSQAETWATRLKKGNWWPGEEEEAEFGNCCNQTGVHTQTSRCGDSCYLREGRESVELESVSIFLLHDTEQGFNLPESLFPSLKSGNNTEPNGQLWGFIMKVRVCQNGHNSPNAKWYPAKDAVVHLCHKRALWKQF